MKVLKFTFLTLILALGANIATAQLGVKAGLNLSSLKYFSDEEDSNFNEEYVTGYQVGAVYVAALGDKLSFQPEAAFYTRGGKAAPEGSSTNFEYAYNYANLNALVNFNLIGNSDGIAIQLTGGVFGGYALDGKFTTTLLGAETETTINFDDDDSYERTNTGYILGAGVKVNDFIISVRGAFGVKEIASFQSSFFNAETSYKTREYSLIAAFLF